MARLRAHGPVHRFFRRLAAWKALPEEPADKGAGDEKAGQVPIPDGLIWEVWELVIHGIATLREIRESWDIVDLIEAQMAMDVKRRAERVLQRESDARMKSQKKGRRSSR